MIFTIETDNNIRVHETEAKAEEAAKAAAGTIVVRSEKELNKAAAGWPCGRAVEQLRGGRAVHGLQARKEVHEPRQGGSAHLGDDRAPGEGDRTEAAGGSEARARYQEG